MKNIIKQLAELTAQGWIIKTSCDHVIGVKRPKAYIRIDIIDGDLESALNNLIDSIMNEII